MYKAPALHTMSSGGHFPLPLEIPFVYPCFVQLGGMVAASSLAEASTEALKTMLSEEHDGLLKAWLPLGRHKVGQSAIYIGRLADMQVYPYISLFFHVPLPATGFNEEIKCTGRGVNIWHSALLPL